MKKEIMYNFGRFGSWSESTLNSIIKIKDLGWGGCKFYEIPHIEHEYETEKAKQVKEIKDSYIYPNTNKNKKWSRHDLKEVFIEFLEEKEQLDRLDVSDLEKDYGEYKKIMYKMFKRENS